MSRVRSLAGLALALALALPASAAAQSADRATPSWVPAPGVSPPLPPVPPGVIQLLAGEPGGRIGPPLDVSQRLRLNRADGMRQAGMLDSARVVLERLLVEVPHHPFVLRALAQVFADRSAWADLERLALRERLATRDSTLLGQELALAQERGGRPAAAAQTAIEAWVASPFEADWAQSTLARLNPAASKAVRDALHRAVDQRPERPDLARGLARLDWASGDARAALRTLTDADRAGARPSARWSFAEDLLRRGGAARDSAGAVDVLLDVAGDRAAEMPYRVGSAQRAWEVATARSTTVADAPRLARALADLPPERWDTGWLVAVARALREGGHTAESRALLAPLGAGAQAPGVSIERALADLRDGPPARALPALRAAATQSGEGAWRYAEALFFAGQADSARSWYGRVAEDPASPFTGRALERLFLLEDADPPAGLPAFGQLAYAEWRGDTRGAAVLADSLWRTLPRGALWAQAAVRLAALRDVLGDPRAALVPLLAVADSLPGDRLAPLARQRIGDLYLDRIHDEAQALAQYEECLARYPKAWNAPEVRRRVETLRRERRF